MNNITSLMINHASKFKQLYDKLRIGSTNMSEEEFVDFMLKPAEEKCGDRRDLIYKSYVVYTAEKEGVNVTSSTIISGFYKPNSEKGIKELTDNISSVLGCDVLIQNIIVLEDEK